MDLFDLSAAVHLDLSEIDIAIKKMERLLELLERAKELSQDRG